MHAFLQHDPRREDYWRSIILFGRNVASYKFALAKSLLELSTEGSDLITLEALSDPFARHICSHLIDSPMQSTSPKSAFLDACRGFNAGEISEEKLLETTQRQGFKYVIDAFHVVNQQAIPTRFFVDERATSGGLRITNDLYELLSAQAHEDLKGEAEARWRLVETAWELGMSRQLIAVEHDEALQSLLTTKRNRRVAVTSSRAALNGYQKGHCFYCSGAISIQPGCALNADIDHFIPHVAGLHIPHLSVNGVWNLVLACQACNRGPMGKFARVPSIKLLERLHKRNEYLISSHHPLRETLMAQTGQTTAHRQAFLQQRHNEATTLLIHQWEPQELQEPML